MPEKTTFKIGATELKIDADFYANIAKYLQELETEKNNADPDSTKYAFARDLLETAKSKARDYIESRTHKIITEALTQCGRRNKKATSMPMTPEEQKLYDEVHAMVSGWVVDRHQQVFGDSGAKKAQVQTKLEKEGAGTGQATAQTTGQEIKKKDNGFKEYITVRMLRDVPTFVGVDKREYTLSREDVVMVPTVNGKVLVGKKVAVQMNMLNKK